jgi:hypothetical protein
MSETLTLADLEADALRVRRDWAAVSRIRDFAARVAALHNVRPARSAAGVTVWAIIPTRFSISRPIRFEYWLHGKVVRRVVAAAALTDAAQRRDPPLRSPDSSATAAAHAMLADARASAW